MNGWDTTLDQWNGLRASPFTAIVDETLRREGW